MGRLNAAQRIVKNTFSLLLSGAIAHIFIFLTMVYLARQLGPDNFGKLSFATAVIAYFTLLTHLGLPLWATREVAQHKDASRRLFGAVLSTRLALALLSFVLLLIFIFFLPKPLDLKILLLYYGFGLFISALSIDWLFQGIEKMEFIGLGRILAAVIFSGLAFMFVKTHNDILMVPVFQVLGAAVAASALVLTYCRLIEKPRLRIDFLNSKQIIKQALPLGLSIILIQIIYSIDTVMLGFLKSDAEIGFYNAAYKIIMAVILVGSIYFDAVFPVLSKYFSSSLTEFKNLQQYNARLITIVVFPIIFSGIVLAPHLISTLYGPAYHQSIIPFKILVFVAALIYLNMIYARGMWACNLQKQYLAIVAAQAATNIAFNFILIPPYGINGAAISTLIAELAGFYFYHRQFNRVTSVPIYRYVFKPLSAMILVLAIFMLMGQQPLVLMYLFSMTAYFLILIMCGAITKIDLNHLSSIFAARK